MKLLGSQHQNKTTIALLAGLAFILCSLHPQVTEAQEKKSINKYHESITVLNVQLEKIRENQERLDRLFEEKNRVSNRSRAIEIIAEVNVIEKDNKRLRKEARRLQYDIKYLYPEKGEELERLYKRSGVSISQEEDITFSERINNVLSYAKKVYGPTAAEVHAAEQALLRKQAEEAKKHNDPKSRFERLKIQK